MEWRVKVESFEEIRREYQFGIGTKSGVAHELGVHHRVFPATIRNRNTRMAYARAVKQFFDWREDHHLGPDDRAKDVMTDNFMLILTIESYNKFNLLNSAQIDQVVVIDGCLLTGLKSRDLYN